MRGAFGKPQGTVARVHIGQPIISVRARENSKDSVIEALRRAKFKFPGRQKVRINVVELIVVMADHLFVGRRYSYLEPMAHTCYLLN